MRLFSSGFLLAGAALVFPSAASAQTSLPTVNAWDKTVKEGNSGLKFTWVGVSLAAPVADTVRVEYWTKPINAAQGSSSLPYKSPGAGTDYRQSGGTLTFLPGERAASVRVAIYGDNQSEGDETFELRLRVVAGSAVAGRVATVTIRDDDATLNAPGKIVFSAFDPETSSQGEIWTINADGSGKKRLTNHPANDSAPLFNADGSEILFASGRNSTTGGQDVYVMNADGSNVRRVTNLDASLGAPRWSADNSQIVIPTAEPLYGLYVVNADGSNLRRVIGTYASDEDVQAYYNANFSPDGNRVIFDAYVRSQSSQFIYSIKTDGTDLRRLTNNSNNTGIEISPVYSPDGRRVAFRMTSNTVSLELWVLNTDGTGLRLVINSRTNGFAWTPDSTSLVATIREGPQGVYKVVKMRAIGTDFQEVYRSTSTDFLDTVIISPDGKWAAVERPGRGLQVIELVSGSAKQIVNGAFGLGNWTLGSSSASSASVAAKSARPSSAGSGAAS